MLSLIKKISRGQERRIVFLVLLILVSNVLEGFGISLILPVFQKLLHQDVSSSHLGEYIDQALRFLRVEPSFGNILVLLNVAFISKTLIAVAAKYYSTQIASDYMNHVQVDLFQNLVGSRISVFNSERQGRFINGMTTEVTRTSNVFIQVANWISTLLTAVLYLGIALKISTQLAILAGTLGLICVAPLRLINIKASKYGAAWTRYNEEIQSLIHETFGGIKYIKASAFANESVEKFKGIARDFRDNWAKMAFNSNLAALFSHPIGVFVLSVLLYMSISLSVSLPELILFLLAFMRLLPTLTSLAGIKNDINANVSAMETIEEIKKLSQANAEDLGAGAKVHFQNAIYLKNVRYRHVSSIPLIEDVNWKVPFGRTVAVVGPSGGGKTTLVDLILRLYDVNAGQILIDGVELTQLSLLDWRKQVSYVSQDTFLFHDTIKKNILLGSPEASDEDIIEASKMAHAHEFISKLEEGYETVVGDRGAKLSGGQRQRIALARALIKKPRLLILDEATSALDQQSEEFIRQTIRELKERRNMTIIIIAHRMTTVEEADEVFTLTRTQS